MSGSTAPLPPRGRASPGISVRAGRGLAGVLLWLVFLCAAAVFAASTFLHFQHQSEAGRRHVLAAEQRRVAAAVAELVSNVGTGRVHALADIDVLRTRSLEIFARLPLEAAAGGLLKEWTRLARGLDVLSAERAPILALWSGLEDLRARGRLLEERSGRLTDASPARERTERTSREVLPVAARRFTEEVERAGVRSAPGLDRARAMLGLYGHSLTILLEEAVRRPASRAYPRAKLAALAARFGVVRRRLDAVRGTVDALAPVSAELGRLAEAGAKVVGSLPELEARALRPPAVLGVPLDGWLFGSCGLAFTGLLGLVCRRQRNVKAELAELDRAWAEAAEADWQARGMVRRLVRVIGALDRRSPASAGAPDGEDLDAAVRDAEAALPRIVARRSQLAVALAPVRDSLKRNVAAARRSAPANLAAPSGLLDARPLVEIEATLREAALFGAAAVARELRASAPQANAGEKETAAEADVTLPEAADEPDSIRRIALRGLDLLDRCIDRALDGAGEEHAALIFHLDDLRTARGMAPFSDSLPFTPELAPSTAAVSGRTANLRSDASRLLPSFRKGLDGWETDAGENGAVRLVRGSVTALAHAAEEKNAPSRGFWSTAAAFCTALLDGAIPRGPAARRMMGEVSREFGNLAERKEEPVPPRRLFRGLLLYVALAESGHEDLRMVREAFSLDRHPIAIPEHLGDEGAAEGEEPVDVSTDLIEQLEELRAALERIDGPAEPDRTP